MRRQLPKIAVLLIVLAFVGRMIQVDREQRQTSTPTTVEVERVIAGDTLKLVDRTRVRLIGVDTPEVARDGKPAEPWADEATEFTREFLAGNSVRLEFDKEREDRYGRTLAYVYVGDQMLNEMLIRAGLSRAELRYDFSARQKSIFREAEKEARNAGRGLWQQNSDGAR